jgi:hypothetical protein
MGIDSHKHCLRVLGNVDSLALPMQRPFQLFRLFLNSFHCHVLQPLGEQLWVGAVESRYERLEAPLLHDGRAGLPDLQDFEHGLALRLDLPHEAVKIPCRVMGCLLDNGLQFRAAEGKAPTLK